MRRRDCPKRSGKGKGAGRLAGEQAGRSAACPRSYRLNADRRRHRPDRAAGKQAQKQLGSRLLYKYARFLSGFLFCPHILAKLERRRRLSFWSACGRYNGNLWKEAIRAPAAVALDEVVRAHRSGSTRRKALKTEKGITNAYALKISHCRCGCRSWCRSCRSLRPFRPRVREGSRRIHRSKYIFFLLPLLTADFYLFPMKKCYRP